MGSVMIEENVVAAAGTSFRASEAEIRHAIAEAGYTPRRRNVFYELSTEPTAGGRVELMDRHRTPYNRQDHRSSPSRWPSAMIHVHGLTKHYADLRRGRLVALGGISFHALPGQIYGLLGPNGAGKTTALRILSTVLRPTAGTRHDQRLRRGHAALAGAAPDRLPVGQHGGLRSHDRLGNGRVFRPALRHPRGRAAGADGSSSSSG